MLEARVDSNTLRIQSLSLLPAGVCHVNSFTTTAHFEINFDPFDCDVMGGAEGQLFVLEIEYGLKVSAGRLITPWIILLSFRLEYTLVNRKVKQTRRRGS